MEIKRKIEMTVATSEIFIIRKASADITAICTKCGSPVLTAEQTAKMFGITQRRIFRIIETDAAHFAETETGALMICLTSLSVILNGEE